MLLLIMQMVELVFFFFGDGRMPPHRQYNMHLEHHPFNFKKKLMKLLITRDCHCLIFQDEPRCPWHFIHTVASLRLHRWFHSLIAVYTA